MTKLAIIYYSATGHGTTMAKRVATAAESAGAEVRVRHVAETRDPRGASLVSTHDNINDLDDPTEAALEHLARRVVTVADRLAAR